MSPTFLQSRWRPSPNHGPRAAGFRPNLLILHYTGMADAHSAIERLCDPHSEVSAHYVIEEDGMVWQLVDERRRAWHAGESYWRGARDINSSSIGIELVNPGAELGHRPFPVAQMRSLTTLAAQIMARHNIRPEDVLGHSDIAPQRKRDPGELFDWPALALQDMGLWPQITAQDIADPPQDMALWQQALQQYGYECPSSGQDDPRTCAVIAAFQRHYRPESITGLGDADTWARLRALLRQTQRG
ncbi:MAG: N-acetylmuramoyl-L-alanine amidase [Alphaproteobacteria bacterium]|nr:MAG: N-acetylmuramoyl-L-alanine amidase [Alphaproteobacteria bacterium]